MTEITTLPDQAAAGANFPVHPADLLLHLIVTILAPMFLIASGGNIPFARMAALETVNAYRARNQADLIAVAQIVAFGLSALGSLSLAMVDDISLTMTLRLRGNANACHRSAEQNRRALGHSRPVAETQAHAEAEAAPDDGFDEQAVLASVAAAQERAEDARTRLLSVAPATETAGSSTQAVAVAPLVATPMTAADQQRQAVWAAAAAKVAAEYTADLSNLPPAERRAATIRAAALSSCAHELLSGTVVPRPRPGDLAALMRPNAT